MDTTEVRKYLEGLDSLSTIPVVLNKIIEIAGNTDAPPEELYRVISYDQTLAERVIRLANSPFFRHAGRVTDIEQAVLFLGYEHIRNIAVSMSSFSVFSKKGDQNLRNFWAHCYEVAAIANLAAASSTMVNRNTAFLAGLLHDIGRLIFFSMNYRQYSSILGTDDLLEKEVELFGCDHAAAGSIFAERAKLPEELVLAIRYHHAPSAAKNYRDIVSVAAIAEVLSRRFSPKIEDDGIWTNEHDALLLELSLSSDDIADMEQRVLEEQGEINEFLEIM